MGSTGDGIIMAEASAGTVLTWGRGDSFGGGSHVCTSVGAIYVNKQGVRFVDETLPYVLGCPLGRKTVRLGSCRQQHLGRGSWSSSHSAKEVEAGRAVRPMIWTLAEKMGVPKARNTVEDTTGCQKASTACI